MTLTKVTLPSGGWLEFEYEMVKKHLRADGGMEYPRVKRRADAYLDDSQTHRKVNERTITYSSPHFDGYPSHASGLPSSYAYWTDTVDSAGTHEKLTFNWRHQMVEKETSNSVSGLAYKQKTEIVQTYGTYQGALLVDHQGTNVTTINVLSPGVCVR